jgi:hypothetical protein
MDLAASLSLLLRAMARARRDLALENLALGQLKREPGMSRMVWETHPIQR